MFICRSASAVVVQRKRGSRLTLSSAWKKQIICEHLINFSVDLCCTLFAGRVLKPKAVGFPLVIEAPPMDCTAAAQLVGQLWDLLPVPAVAALVVAYAFAGRRRVRHAHEFPVSRVAFAPDGLSIASGSLDTCVKVWPLVGSGPGRKIAGNRNWIRSLSFSPDGSTLLSGSGDNKSKIWRLGDGRLLQTLVGYTSCFSPNGLLVATGSLRDGNVRIFTAVDGKRRVMLRGQAQSTNAVCFSPTGSAIAVGSSDSTARVWNFLRDSTAQIVLRGHSGWVTRVCFTRRGATVVTGGSDGTIRVWDVRDGAAIRVLREHTGWISGLTSARLGRGDLIASSSHDGTVRVFCCERGHCITTLAFDDRVCDVAISPDGSHIVVGGYSDTITVDFCPVMCGQCIRVCSSA